MSKKYYVYRHLKPESREVFYIGLGSTTNYSRAYHLHGRNIIWQRVYFKHGIEIEILAKNLSKEDACELETLLIDQYGRRDLGTGPLVNLTDGGEGGYNTVYNEEYIQNWRDSIGDNLYDISQHSKSGKDSNRARAVVNIETGIYYDTAKEAAETQNLVYGSIKQMLSNSRHNHTSFRYVELFEKGVKIIPKAETGTPVISDDGKKFKSIKECASFYNTSPQRISAVLRGIAYNDIGIKYEFGDNSKIRYRKMILESVKNDLKFYSFRDASNKLGVNRGTLKTWVYTKRNTDIISKIISQ